jgi:hypothetical protein
MANELLHPTYKEFFDKRKGTTQFKDHLRYIHKTPSSGMRDFTFYDKKVKYYWDRRVPVHPASVERYSQDQKHGGF